MLLNSMRNRHSQTHHYCVDLISYWIYIKCMELRTSRLQKRGQPLKRPRASENTKDPIRRNKTMDHNNNEEKYLNQINNALVIVKRRYYQLIEQQDKQYLLEKQRQPKGGN